MAYCSNCGASLEDNATSCSSCGAIITNAAPVVNPWDHTDEFDAADISENKVYALCAYALSFFGIIVAVLCAKDSAYVKFHCRESAKLNLFIVVVSILSSALVWTCIVPIAGGIFLCIGFVLIVIAFVQVCQGKAKEPWLIRSIGALH